VLSLLDHDVLRAAFHDPARRLDEVELFGELARLGVVQRDQIHVRQQLENIGTPALDPEVHGVAGDELRLGDLRQHVELEPRVDVAEEHERRRAELLGNLRSKVREDTQVCLQCFRDVEVVTIPAAPAKGRSVGLLEPGDVDRPRREGALQFVERKVGADHADELHRREVARRRREERTGPAEDVVRAPERRLDGIERHGADDENCHVDG
jgi:hypothetical protein